MSGMKNTIDGINKKNRDRERDLNNPKEGWKREKRTKYGKQQSDKLNVTTSIDTLNVNGLCIPLKSKYGHIR